MFNSKHCSFDCVVRNRSEMGVRLLLETPEIIPNTFVFRIPKEGFETGAAVVNRDASGIGIQFTDLNRVQLLPIAGWLP